MSTPDVIEFVIAGAPEVYEVEVGGPQGPIGNPGITVSATAPPSPAQNALWIEVPPDE